MEPVPCLRQQWLVEGPWTTKRGDFYYLFWSGGGWSADGDYSVSVARSLSPLGPFEHYSGNPIIQGTGFWGDGHWASPGHNSLIQDDAGQDWLFYHAYERFKD